jgi:hypothetical protein
MSLLTVIEDIQENLRNIPHINGGGCAVFAALLGQQLKKRGIQFKLRVGDSRGSEGFDPHAVVNARKNNAVLPDDWEKNGVGFGHVVVEVEENGKRYFCDAERTTPATDKTMFLPGWGKLDLYKEPFTLEEIVLVARDKGYWCCVFNRERIPEMIKKISQVLKKDLDGGRLIS